MKDHFTKEKIQYNAPVWACILFILFLFFLPTGYQEIYREADQCVAKVLETDDSAIIDTGLVRSGEQRCKLEIISGKFKGEQTEGVNMLNGSLEQDKMFYPGDTAQVVVSYDGDEILMVTMIDHNRIPMELVMGAIFILFLILFAGRTGIRAVLSFLLTILALWKILVPSYLKGYNPIWMGLIFTLILSLLIIALVYGFDRRCASAVSGTFLGVLVTCVMGAVFTDLFKIHGAVMSSSESLLYAGYQDLNLTRIFMASIFIGASGAIMDLSVDITSAVYEVVEKRPDIGWKEAVKSGMNVGRAAMGTMTTTLLLAYSGGYIALLMVFMAQGTPLINILNYKHVAAEMIHTVIGSFGLVTVAPFTALCAGVFLTHKKEATESQVQETK
ncbi:YibE/F family protein [Negativibacillus massiliensis]|uniref:YibE/F family protein n=1 Tax=Negativibacillus massiliensis TaxID=1871035 RepID=UPI0009784B8D|nr:YibE/F family protein [Negativibacillus massiliensis]MBS5139049.1 YibE/F family protein [Clostridium sp.]MDY4047596.1 YibE/F family protein [Negativibacillus massiliensis]